MPYGINNNIFHGANKLQEKIHWHSVTGPSKLKIFNEICTRQKLVRCNSYMGPVITSPPQITVFTLYVIHSLSTGTYNYKFYINYW
jgi:hypothetical protein